ncbi:hypothetical protein C8R46DRAFT_1347997 [Mycena filopes]|nr:hypothetical protein C8R46DRAFT_1347997 [Mycena filopes]
MIQSLCVDVVQEIGKQLPRRAQKDLRAACRSTGDAVAPLFFSFVVLNTTYLRRETAIWGLEHLATGESGWSMHAKTLKIAPSQTYVRALDKDPISESALQALFTSALGSLMNVRHVRWDVTDDDPSWQRDVVAEYLRSLPLLTSLEIGVWGTGTRDFSVPRLSGLRRLKITTDVVLTESASRAIAHNRGLTSLTLSLGSYGTTPAHLWPILHENGVYLREISTTCVCTDLLDYLRSYSGVEKLSLKGMGGGESSADSNTCADIFYQTVLAHHAESLVKLTCPIGYENNWTFGTHSVAAISQLSRLVRLRVGVTARDTVLRRDGEVNVLDLLFDTAATAIPGLRTLSVSPCHGSHRTRHHNDVEAAIKAAFQAHHGHPYTREFVQHEIPLLMNMDLSPYIGPPRPIVSEGVVERLRLRWAIWIESDGFQQMSRFLFLLELGLLFPLVCSYVYYNYDHASVVGWFS